MSDAVAAPMALTGYARRVVSSNSVLAEAIAAKYWEPKRTWNYLEYLGSAMTISKDGARFVPPVVLDQQGLVRKKLYDEDSANAAIVDWLAGQP